MSTTRSWRDVDTTYRNASGIVCDRVPTSFLWESMTLLFYCGYLNHALRYFNVSNNQPVHLTVLYESLCPASLEFVVEHLYPAHEKHGMYFHTELVPYGLAYMNQVWNPLACKISLSNLVALVNSRTEQLNASTGSANVQLIAFSHVSLKTWTTTSRIYTASAKRCWKTRTGSLRLVVALTS